MKLEYTVYGEPVPQGRPRFVRRGNFVQTYDPEKSKKYKKLIQSSIKPLDVKIDFPVSVSINIFKGIPKSISKKKRQDMIDGLILPTSKPDVDNYAKIVLDALNDVLWIDDSYIVRLVINKYYSDTPRVEITVSDKGV